MPVIVPKAKQPTKPKPARRKKRRKVKWTPIGLVALGVILVAYNVRCATRSRVVQRGEKQWVVSPDGHRAALSMITRKAAVSAEQAMYLFEVHMVLPDGARIPVAAHEIPADEMPPRVDREALESYIEWSTETHAFILKKKTGQVRVFVPF